MTLILGITATILVVGLLALVAKNSAGQGDVLAFTSPQDLHDASTVASAPPSSPLMGSPVAASSLSASRPLHTPGATNNDFYPGNLGVGTSITLRGETSEIVGVISFEHGGEIWQDYLMAMPNDRWWRLGVEPDRNMRLLVFAPTTSHAQPGAEQITHDGRVFTMTESGQANYRTVGQTGRFDKGSYWFFDYRNDANQVLNFERFDSSPWVVSIGRQVPAAELQISNYAAEPNW